MEEYRFRFDYSLPPEEKILNELEKENERNFSILVILHGVEREGEFIPSNIEFQALFSEETINGFFRLSGKSVSHYLFFIYTILVLLLISFSLIQFLRMPIQLQKLRWLLFLSFGLGKGSIDWISGEVSFSALSVTLAGVGTQFLPYKLLILEVSIPLGALIFLYKRKKWLALHKTNQRAED